MRLLRSLFSSPKPRGNALFTIEPYRWGTTWVFDYEAYGIVKEAFVAGMPRIIGIMTHEQGITAPDAGFQATFASSPFPGFQYKLVKSEDQTFTTGTDYDLCDPDDTMVTEDDGTIISGWLCPCLLNFFPTPPDTIYVMLKSL